MKISLYTFLILSCLLSACKENKPIIPCLSCVDSGGVPDPTTTIKKVLMEEFTGVRCVNCPQAKSEIANLQSDELFGENLIAVSYHAGFFAAPYSDSKGDYRTKEGTEILSFLESPIGFPSAVINRKKFAGEGDLQLEQFAAWGGFVSQALAEEAQLSIDIATSFNQSNRNLNITVSIKPLASIIENLNLTVLITENNIVDVQLTSDGKVDNYVQADVFRGMVTNTFGTPVESLEVGLAVSKIFSFTLPENWVAENCSIVAFVHQATEGKEVLQVEEVALSF